ncbi:MAG TPA: STAS domain-containing protein [Terriglobales bacterium]|nr:STAS domain-containing protein [Terriglobales bacterium]
MATSAVEPNIDEKQIISALHAATEKLEDHDGELVLDISTVRRIDTNAVRALEELVQLAEGKAVKVALRGANIDVYKVLKLVKLDTKFSFLNGHGQRSTKLENFHAEPTAK